MRSNKPCPKIKAGSQTTRDLSSLEAYQYDLPEDLIAQAPSDGRDSSRLMVIDRDKGSIEHMRFSDIEFVLSGSDLLVINNTKVVPAALDGKKTTGGGVEVLCLNPSAGEALERPTDNAVRECMIKSSKPLKAGQSILLNTGVELKVAQPLAGGRALMEFPVTSPSLEEFLWEHGRPPLPPYIKTGPHNLDRDKKRYQTVYSKIAGSVAAPTAGFHFSENLMSALEERGVEIVEITLHVGPGTFLPIRASRLSAHRMEKEYVPPLGEAYGRIERARAMGKRIIAVGSTSMRTLESLGALDDKAIKERGFWTDLFIRPGFQFKLTSGLITNFHLPASTLLALVCAFGGYDLIMRAYEEAIKLRYRFYSYGDACLII